jgi:hypothetical protein
MSTFSADAVADVSNIRPGIFSARFALVKQLFWSFSLRRQARLRPLRLAVKINDGDDNVGGGWWLPVGDAAG